MKKNEIKRAIRIHNTVLKQKRKLMTKLLFVALCMFTIPAIAAGLNDPEGAKGAIVMAGTSVGLASMAFIGNIDDTSDKDTAGKQIDYRVWLVTSSQLDRNVRFPRPNTNREMGTLPLLPGEVFHYFEAHDIPTDNSTAEKGDITTETTNTFVMIMSGNRDKLLDFCEEHTGDKFIVIYGESGTDNYHIMGSPHKPMILKKYERKNDKEGRYITFTFENNSFCQPYRYKGAIIKADPVTLAPGATTLAIVANNDQYMLPDSGGGSTTIGTVSGLTSDDKGRNITVKGSGSSNAATIEENAVFILQDGATFTATAGSSIAFRILDTNRLVEIEGSRVQA